MTDERERKAKRLLDSLEALRLACKQLDLHAHEFQDVLAEDLKDGSLHHTGTAPKP